MLSEVIVHHLTQACAVLRAAEDAGVSIQLRSAPGASAYAGVGYLHALGEAADHPLVIDCGDDAGLTMAALRTGCRKLVFLGSSEKLERLCQMAKGYGSVIRGPMDPFPPCLTLSPDDDGETVRSWLISMVKS